MFIILYLFIYNIKFYYYFSMSLLAFFYLSLIHSHSVFVEYIKLN